MGNPETKNKTKQKRIAPFRWQLLIYDIGVIILVYLFVFGILKGQQDLSMECLIFNFATFIICIFASRLIVEYWYIGEFTLSVMLMIFAFLLLANSMAFKALTEYLGKLMPMTTSFSLIRIICSKISLMLFVEIRFTSSTTMRR